MNIVVEEKDEVLLVHEVAVQLCHVDAGVLYSPAQAGRL